MSVTNKNQSGQSKKFGSKINFIDNKTTKPNITSTTKSFGLSPAKHEWRTTLQSIGECKAVISVDTAVAHLAAGSGQPIHLLLGDPPDWRWRPVPQDPSAPLWYPNISIEKLQQPKDPNSDEISYH